GVVHLHLEQNELAAMCFTACLAIRDDFAPAWVNRGLALTRMRFFPLAIKDYDRAVALDPGPAEAYVQRSEAKIGRKDFKGAEEDLTAALATGKAPVQVYFLRARVRRERGNAAGATADRTAGLALIPTDDVSWVGRAEQREEETPTGALADVEE